MGWLEDYRAETGKVIAEPWMLCLAEAIACVESAWGAQRIVGPGGFNEIGYKAVPGKPSIGKDTREAGPDGAIEPARAAFRLFADRAEQAQALLWLMRSSAYYEAARLLGVLAFYSAYAPGRIDGIGDLACVFNKLARSGAHPGVRPFALVESASAGGGDAETLAYNHAAARQAVRLFAQMTGQTTNAPERQGA
jgi:hypothetical protein